LEEGKETKNKRRSQENEEKEKKKDARNAGQAIPAARKPSRMACTDRQQLLSISSETGMNYISCAEAVSEQNANGHFDLKV
jgi:hypothetical protein